MSTIACYYCGNTLSIRNTEMVCINALCKMYYLPQLKQSQLYNELVE